MGFFNNDYEREQQRDFIVNQYDGSEDHKAKLTHEVIAGAAAYEAAKKYEEHVEQNGQPESYAKAKELLAGFSGAFIDREAETRGMDFLDRERAKYEARKQADQGLNNSGASW